MKKYLIAALIVSMPIAGFCQSQVTCRELDVNNKILQLQLAGRHVLSVRNLTPNALPCNATWVIVYE